MSLTLVPTTISDACAYVAQHHRHHGPPVSGLFAVAVAEDERICGVAIVGRPVARALQDGWTAEVTRVAVAIEVTTSPRSGGSIIETPKNACSMLYGACWRAARALGWRRLVTYTLSSEGGGSVRAAGWRLVGEAGGGSWSCPSRPRVDRHPTQGKLRWEIA